MAGVVKKKEKRGRKALYLTEEDRHEAHKQAKLRYQARKVHLGAAAGAWEEQKLQCGFRTDPEFAAHLLTQHNGRCVPGDPSNRSDHSPNTIPTVLQPITQWEKMPAETVAREMAEVIGEEESLIEIEGVSVESSDEPRPSHDALVMYPFDEEISMEMKTVAEDSEEIYAECIDETEDVWEESVDGITRLPDYTVEEIGNKLGLTTQKASPNIGNSISSNLHWCSPCQLLLSDTEIKSHQLSHFNGRLMHCAKCIEGFPTERLVQDHVRGHLGHHINRQLKPAVKMKRFEVARYVKDKYERRLLWGRSPKRTVSRRVGLNMNMKKYGRSISSTSLMSKNQAADILNQATQLVSCRLCRASFKSQPEVVRHSQVHFTETPYKCRLCEKYFNTQDILTQHEAQLCDKIIHTCGTCGKVFRKREGLMHHQLNHPTHKRNQKDNDSGHIPPTKSAKSSESSHIHKQRQRQGAYINSPNCKLCGEGFESWGNVASHLYVHNVKTPYRCGKCEKYFRTQDECTKHETALCILVNPITCGSCEKVFQSRNGLATHVQVHHKDLNHSPKSQKRPKPQATPMRCNIVQNKPMIYEIVKKEKDGLTPHSNLGPSKSTSDLKSCNELALLNSASKQPKLSTKKSTSDLKSNSEFAWLDVASKLSKASSNKYRSRSKFCGPLALVDSTKVQPRPSSSTSRNDSEFQNNLAAEESVIEQPVSSLSTELAMSDGASKKTRKTSFRCASCWEVFESIKVQREHSLIHEQPTPYKCPTCGKYFLNGDKLREHVDLIHQCTACGKVLKTKLAHRCAVQNNEPRFMCETCGKTFSSKAGLERHTYHHTGAWPFVCSVCDKGYPTKDRLDFHMAVHLNHRPCICQTCGKGFVRPGDLNIHLLTHIEERSHGCDVCGKMFKSERHLVQHKQCHNNSRQEICTVCKLSFVSKKSLRSHMRTHGGVERQHNCSKCSKLFYTASDVRRHMLTHTKERSHKCEVCGDTFQQKGHLRTHMMGHTGEWSHKCGLCGKGYGNPGHLSKHMKDNHGST